MLIRRRNPLEPQGGTETPESFALSRLSRRTVLALGGISAAAIGYGGYRWYRGTDEQVLEHGRVEATSTPEFATYFPAPLDGRFEYGRLETIEAEAARYTNFFEFSSSKHSWRYVDAFQPLPWTLTIDGLCDNKMELSFDELLKRYKPALTERQYRHRCVEKWAMAIPWTGIPLLSIIKDAAPSFQATHVRFVSFNRPGEAEGIRGNPSDPWPYCEGLTIREAQNELCLLAVGMYGHPLLKQHGAPLRLVVPWKYGYKSIKSVERIQFVSQEPPTFWSTLNPSAYPFQSNVDPTVPRPWPQNVETMLGSGEIRPTEPFNGYGEYVAHLYS